MIGLTLFDVGRSGFVRSTREYFAHPPMVTGSPPKPATRPGCGSGPSHQVVAHSPKDDADGLKRLSIDYDLGHIESSSLGARWFVVIHHAISLFAYALQPMTCSVEQPVVAAALPQEPMDRDASG